MTRRELHIGDVSCLTPLPSNAVKHGGAFPVRENKFPGGAILVDFGAEFSAYVHKLHPHGTAKRVALDIERISGQRIPLSTVYKWISGEKRPTGPRRAAVLITYPEITLRLYGALVDNARRRQSARLQNVIAQADAALAGAGYD